MLKLNSVILGNLFFSCIFLSLHWCRACLGTTCLAAFLAQHLAECKKSSEVRGQDTCHDDEAHTWWPVGHPLLLMLLFSPWAVFATEFHQAEVLGHTPQRWCPLLSLFFKALSEIIVTNKTATISCHAQELSIPATPQEREQILRTTGKLKSPHSVTFLNLQRQG